MALRVVAPLPFFSYPCALSTHEYEKNPGRDESPGQMPRAFDEKGSGGDLLSQGATPQVPSAQAGLTSVFGMGTGVTPPLWPPENLLNWWKCGCPQFLL